MSRIQKCCRFAHAAGLRDSHQDMKVLKFHPAADSLVGGALNSRRVAQVRHCQARPRMEFSEKDNTTCRVSVGRLILPAVPQLSIAKKLDPGSDHELIASPPFRPLEELRDAVDLIVVP